MSISTVKVIDRTTAEARLVALHQKVGDVESFKSRGEGFDLDAEGTALYAELRDLEFLLHRD